MPLNVQSEMTACLAVLALSGEFWLASTRLPWLLACRLLCTFADPSLTRLSRSRPPLVDDLKPTLLELGICEVLIPLTNSPSVEVQGNSAAAIGNLSSKGTSLFLSRVFSLVTLRLT